MPPTTATPPVGFAAATEAIAPNAIATRAAEEFSRNKRDAVDAAPPAPGDFRAALPISETATMAPSAWFQTVRKTWLSDAWFHMMQPLSRQQAALPTQAFPALNHRTLALHCKKYPLLYAICRHFAALLPALTRIAPKVASPKRHVT
ncbi:hypothetical protein RQP54_01405 [Curvibacter sp. APW13]|nr:hypothetical protein [Curvibacter sp. APW13]MDT8989513.1 hypothetical protein [Curvibacter sp. APW13]